MRAFIATCVVVLFATSAAAQTDQGLSFRPFVMMNAQRFAAEQTFEAVFGQATQVFWGGGLNITQDDQFYFELSASRFKKTGQRAFFSDGQSFGLGIPLTATLTPLELTGGYRFHRKPAPPPRTPGRPPPPARPAGPARFIPYLGGGIGLYQYKETSDFAQPGDDVDTQHVGVILEGGVEVRLQRWIGIAGEVHYSYVPGILGDGGISKEAGESSLGGLGVRVKLVVGR